MCSPNAQLRVLSDHEVFQFGHDEHRRLATAHPWCARRALLQIAFAGRTQSWHAGGWQSSKVFAVTYSFLAADGGMPSRFSYLVANASLSGCSWRECVLLLRCRLPWCQADGRQPAI